MLLRFGGENFRSISEYQEILLTASPNAGSSDESLINTQGFRGSLLPIVEIYGGNSSGKTNLLLILRYIVSKIILSAEGDTSKISVPKFKLDEKYKDKKSSFDIDFICKDQHYHYGFAIKNNIVVEEWLYQTSYTQRKSTTTLFYRDIEDDEEFYFGKPLKGKNKAIASATPKGTLFLSQAAKLEHPLLSDIHSYFSNNYEFRFSVDLNEQNIGESISENNLSSEISKFLSLVDVGAVKLYVEEGKFDEKQITIMKSIGSVVTDVMKTLGDAKLIESMESNDIEDYFEDAKEYKIKITRKNAQKKDITFSFDQESLGTRALISFLASSFQVLKNGGVFVVDEVESSLHTLLTLKLVELFSNKRTNPHGAQLIFSTHETQLMNFNGVRRDEIWLTEKCQSGSTKVSSLEEFSIDKRANWQKGYIEGRFGAIPILGYIDNYNLLGTGTQDATEKA